MQYDEHQKDILLTDIRHMQMIPTAEEWEIIYQCSADSDVTHRTDAAEILGMRCNEKDEERLLQMTYDREDELVRICAIEALGVGRMEKSLKRLYELMRTGGKMTRGYAANSFFDVWVNRYGYTTESVRKCWRKMGKLYKKERNLWVRSSYETCRYLSGDKDGLQELKKIFREAKGEGDTQSAAFYSLEYIRNVRNEAEVNQMIEEAIAYVEESYWLRGTMKKALETKEIPMVLIIDRENAGLSFMMKYLGKEIDTLWIESAGVHPADRIKAEVGEKLGKSSDFIERYYAPRGVRRIYNYNYIVPLGIRLNPEKYPFHKIIPIFEGVGENMLDVEKAKRMLDELKVYVDNDLKGG